jgi:hypothetical protein
MLTDVTHGLHKCTNQAVDAASWVTSHGDLRHELTRLL